MGIMRRERGQLLADSLERGAFEWPPHPLEAFRRIFEQDQVKVEEFTEDGELVVRADLPGVEPANDLDISIVDGDLHLRAERHHEEKVERRNYRRTEIRYGSFSRIVPLPGRAKEDDIKATYRDGILEVRIPLDPATAKSSKIPISRSWAEAEVSWSDVPEADRVEQHQEVDDGDGDEEVLDSLPQPDLGEVPLDAPDSDVIEQHQRIRSDDDEEWPRPVGPGAAWSAGSEPVPS
jgi:HSP20 family protein